MEPTQTTNTAKNKCIIITANQTNQVLKLPSDIVRDNGLVWSPQLLGWLYKAGLISGIRTDRFIVIDENEVIELYKLRK